MSSDIDIPLWTTKDLVAYGLDQVKHFQENLHFPLVTALKEQITQLERDRDLLVMQLEQLKAQLAQGEN